MVKKEKIKQQLKARRRNRIRVKIFGTAKKPRLNVFRSLSHLYVQLIDDQKGATLASAKDSEIKANQAKKVEVAFKVGELIAAKARKLGVQAVVFDKGSNKYHGRVKAVAEGARTGGLEF